MNYNTAENVHLAADVVLLAEHPTTGALHVLLIERGKDPFQGRWALPGGHVDSRETFQAAAFRELTEDTGIDIAQLEQVGVYDDPERDPRGRYIGVAFVAVLDHMPTPTAGDDARTAEWVMASNALRQSDRLAFDHAQILADAMAQVGHLTRTRTTNIASGSARVGQQVGIQFRF
ncbi:NUDIX domain-containing protein [Nocardia salmonicida]|uniref:NUDIX domain-containing protein n=1 Tax=Nocardia salmonicida TaxID=53431 RepID=UPI000A033A54|nr:NUDIX hydrolase [Nocardia salmonicida]MBC7299436.1 NUDIX hydrolase [Nocardia sp.]